MTRSARRATIGTTACHSRTVADCPFPCVGSTIQVTSASTTTCLARVRSGPVSATLCSRSKRREATAPRTVSSLTARRPRRPISGCTTSSTSLAHGSLASSVRPASLQTIDRRMPGAARTSSGTSSRT